MQPTIPEYKRQQAEQIRRDREAWIAKGNQPTQLPSAGKVPSREVAIVKE